MKFGINRTSYLFLTILVLITGCTVAPEAILTERRKANARYDVAELQRSASVPPETVCLHDAIAYALEHNLRLWMARQERAIALEEQFGATLKMLPGLQMNLEQSRRNTYHASSSVDLFTGEESLTTSYSSEKEKGIFDLSATWNLLDFGVTYLRARQEAGRSVIAAQDVRRMRQRVVMDVTIAFWQAVSAGRLAKAADDLLQDIDRQVALVRGQLQQGNISESDAISAELPLQRQRHRIRTYRRDYQAALQNLAKLMGVPAGARFDVADPGDLSIPGTDVVDNLQQLEKTALQHRPELFREDMRERISLHDARIALMEMFPAPSVFWRYNYDDNKYLHAGDWQTVGLTAAWDIFSIPQKIATRRARIKETELAKKRRLATTIAILTQVHIAAIEYQSALIQMKDVTLIEEKSRRLVELSKKAAQEGKGHAGQTLSLKTQRVEDMESFLRSYVALMTARAKLYNSLGIDPTVDGELTLPSASCGEETKN